MRTFWSLALLSLAAACGGRERAPEVHVHVAGWIYGADGLADACVWTNGVRRPLGDGLLPSLATGIALDGADEYVSGSILTDGSVVRAVFWWNGAEVLLSDGTSDAGAEALAVANGQVFVVGHELVGNAVVATLWRNGSPERLAEVYSGALAVAVSPAGDVYVAGAMAALDDISPRERLSHLVPTLWKNGVATRLTTAPLDSGEAEAVTLIGEEPHVAGWVATYGAPHNVAAIWAKGTETRLGDGAFSSRASGIATLDGSVMAAGGAHDGVADVARVWLDGRPSDLTSAGLDRTIAPGYAVGVATANGSAYVVGEHDGAPVVWVDGVEGRLATGGLDANARAIALDVR